MFKAIIIQNPVADSVKSKEVQYLLSSKAMHYSLLESLLFNNNGFTYSELNCKLLTRSQVREFVSFLHGSEDIHCEQTSTSDKSRWVIAFINLDGECIYWMFWGYSLNKFRTKLVEFLELLPRNLI